MLDISDLDNLFADQAEIEAYLAVKRIDEILVGHQSFMDGYNGIRACIKASVHAREPTGCMLLGEGGMGKTSLSRLIQKSMKPKTVVENDLEIDTVPAFYTSFKSVRSLDALTTDILKKLNDPHPTIGKVGDKASRVLDLLKRCRTIIVFVDELHDLEGLAKRDFERMGTFIKWIKELCNECGPVICLMGTPECHDIFDGDTQMSRRFKPKFFLRSLSPGTKDCPGPLLWFLRDVSTEILARTPLKALPPIHEYSNALRIYAAAGGNLDFTMALMKQAALITLLEKRTAITLDDFARVWDMGILNSATKVKFNPFRATENELAAGFRKQA